VERFLWEEQHAYTCVEEPVAERVHHQTHKLAQAQVRSAKIQATPYLECVLYTEFVLYTECVLYIEPKSKPRHRCRSATTWPLIDSHATSTCKRFASMCGVARGTEGQLGFS
jgi:hypothetical protein